MVIEIPLMPLLSQMAGAATARCLVGLLPASTAAANLRMGKAQRWNRAPLKMTPKSLRLARCIRTIGAHSRWSRLSSPAFLAAKSKCAR